MLQRQSQRYEVYMSKKLKFLRLYIVEKINLMGKFAFSPNAIRIYDILSIIMISIVASQVVEKGFLELRYLVFGCILLMAFSVIIMHGRLEKYKYIARYQSQDAKIRRLIIDINIKSKKGDEEREVDKKLTFNSVYHELISVSSDPYLYILLWWLIMSFFSLIYISINT